MSHRPSRYRKTSRHPHHHTHHRTCPFPCTHPPDPDPSVPHHSYPYRPCTAHKDRCRHSRSTHRLRTDHSNTGCYQSTTHPTASSLRTDCHYTSYPSCNPRRQSTCCCSRQDHHTSTNHSPILDPYPDHMPSNCRQHLSHCTTRRHPHRRSHSTRRPCRNHSDTRSRHRMDPHSASSIHMHYPRNSA